jgi:F-type H+-transporting ATPase subunit alpha
MSQHLNPSEISELIKSRITDLKASAEARNEGTVVSVSDGIVRIHGLADVMYGEMIEFDGGLFGMALNLEQDSVGAVVLGNYLSLQEGAKAAAPAASWKCRSVRNCWAASWTPWVTRLTARAR